MLICFCFSISSESISKQDTNITQNHSRTITLTQPSFTQVLGGDVLSKLERTENGFIAITEGRLITSFTENGFVLWQKGTKGRPSNFITVCQEDLFYSITDNSKLNMHNPNGLILWSVDTGIKIMEKPLCGKDGRVFIKGQNTILCYGTKGICRWKLEIQDSLDDIPLLELNDGSLLIFLKTKTSKGESKSIRISPFGKILEEISFTGQVSLASSFNHGVFLCFTDGNSGLCSVEKGSAMSKWTLNASNKNTIKPTTIIENTTFPNEILIFSSSTNEVISIDEINGKILNKYKLPEAIGNNILRSETTSQGIVLITKEKAICLQKDGTVLWNIDLSKTSNWSQCVATDSGNLIFTTNDWTIKGIEIWKNQKKLQSSYKKFEIKSYSDFYSFNNVIPPENITNEQYLKILNGYKKGYFGEKEEEWLPFIESQISKMQEDWLTTSSSYYIGKPFFQTNIPRNEMVLKLAQSSGSIIYQKKISTMLKNIKDPSVLFFLVEAAGECGFDPNLDMLNAIDQLVEKSIQINDENFQINICDAAYKICRYMGRSSFIEKGQKIITKLTYPQYSYKTRNYAMQTLKKILDLKL